MAEPPNQPPVIRNAHVRESIKGAEDFLKSAEQLLSSEKAEEPPESPDPKQELGGGEPPVESDANANPNGSHNQTLIEKKQSNMIEPLNQPPTVESDATANLNGSHNQIRGVEEEEETSPSITTTMIDYSQYNLFQRAAMRMARSPRTHFAVAFGLALTLSIVGFVAGGFSVAVDNAGWTSRGTLRADRQTQVLMIQQNELDLFSGEEAAWSELETAVQSGWETGDDWREEEGDDENDDNVNPEAADDTRRILLRGQQAARQPPSDLQKKAFQMLLHRHLKMEFTIIDLNNNASTPSPSPASSSTETATPSSSPTAPATSELTDSATSYPFPESLLKCDTEWYTDGRMTYASRLWPVWQVKKKQSALDPQVLEDLCVAEAASQQILVENGLCQGCSDGCLPPYSLILYIRLMSEELGTSAMEMDCPTLVQYYRYTQWNLRSLTEQAFQDCVEALMETKDLEQLPEECPPGFYPSLLDEFFLDTGAIQYTSSIYNTNSSEENIQLMYNQIDDYHRGTSNIEGAYDTQYEDFLNILADEVVSSDMLLATASAFITALAMLLHTRSFFLTLVGILQILLSFPMAYFTYRFLGGLTFFPFLNFIGVFVIFALGADHVFVAVDKWKNARKDFPTLTTEQVAAKALPDAAEAMFLTTSTTAIAFFGTAICPIAPIRMFAIFCGLLIVWDYLLDIVLLFPALCIYDEHRENPNCCMTCHCCRQCEGGKEEITDDEDIQNSAPNEETTDGGAHELHLLHDRYKNVDDDHKPSLIRRILLGYYSVLHTIRWPLLVGCAAAFAVCLYVASTLQLPTTSDVRLLRPDQEFEKAYAWRLHLLSSTLSQASGSTAVTIWGVTPADTGDHNNPNSWSQLVLDESFDPSTTAAQNYLKDFCGSFFNQEFASVPYEGYECPINVFDNWLQTQSTALSDGNETTTRDAIYTQHCDGSQGLPIDDPETFHPCLTAWAQQEGESTILSREGIVTLIYISFAARVRYDSPSEELNDEWQRTEKWFDEYQMDAPEEVKKAYFSSVDYWWYDTNIQMFYTAIGSAAIAISAAAVIILLSSRSLIMTLFSGISVLYVLASVTACMVALEWRLGFLESICFAILIGISVDFVIHFSHAYASLPGTVVKERRTKHALIYMGPSILAAAITTMAGAVVMLFCVITFFTKFATILFFTIVQSLIGSFVIFLTMADTIGPTNPTHLMDNLVAKCKDEKGEVTAEPEREAPEKCEDEKGEVTVEPKREAPEKCQAEKGEVTAEPRREAPPTNDEFGV